MTIDRRDSCWQHVFDDRPKEDIGRVAWIRHFNRLMSKLQLLLAELEVGEDRVKACLQCVDGGLRCGLGARLVDDGVHRAPPFVAKAACASWISSALGESVMTNITACSMSSAS
ncbi:hypothetical protein D9M69_643700 [compost metagenome]